MMGTLRTLPTTFDRFIDNKPYYELILEILEALIPYQVM